jgi:GntR family transcriptional regulator
MTTPMYRDIADQLRQQIDSGEFEAGKQLPTEQDLQKEYSASRNTIRDAIKLLITLGLVETRPGQGTFVVPPVDPFVTTLSGDPENVTPYTDEVGSGDGDRKGSVSPVQVEIQEASGDVARRLDLSIDSEVISRHLKRYIDGIPWSLETSFYPGDFADRGADLLRRAKNIEQGTVAYLREKLGMRQVGYRDSLVVRSPNLSETDFFKIPGDGRVNVFEISRTAFDGNGQPMRLTVTVYRVDRNQFLFEVGDVPDLHESEKPSSPDAPRG